MRPGGFDTTRAGSVEAVAAVAAPRDVASSSPSKNTTSALDVMRYQQRITPDVLPLANGSGSGTGSSTASRKPIPAPAPRSSTDVHDAPADDSSGLASHLAATSLDQHKPRARAPLPLPPASSSAGAIVIRSPARDLVNQPPSGFANHTAPSPTVAGSSAAPVISPRLQWGHNKRSRGRRDAPLLPTPAPAPETPAQARRHDAPLLPTPAIAPFPAPAPETPAQARRRASLKIQRRNNAAAAASASASGSQVPAEKLMPPPSARGGPIIRVAPSLPPRPAAMAAAGALYGRTTIVPFQRSAEEPRAGASAEPQQSAAAAVAKGETRQPQQQRPQRQAPSEKEKGKGLATIPAEPPKPKAKAKAQQQPAAELQKLVAAAAAAASPKRPELPRIVTQLTRKEKEEDFLAMKGTKLPQRTKKRPKAAEKAVTQICPGQWLSDVSRARYMVREKKSRKEKRGGGLKAMDSDSD